MKDMQLTRIAIIKRLSIEMASKNKSRVQTSQCLDGKDCALITFQAS